MSAPIWTPTRASMTDWQSWKTSVGTMPACLQSSSCAQAGSPASFISRIDMKTLQFDKIDLDISTRTVWAEARNQPLAGKQAVAWTIRTRAQWDELLDPDHPGHEWWGVTPSQVCQHPWQYSSWNTTDPN